MQAGSIATGLRFLYIDRMLGNEESDDLQYL